MNVYFRHKPAALRHKYNHTNTHCWYNGTIYNTVRYAYAQGDELHRLRTTGAALLENNEATTKSTSQDGGMAVNFG